MTTYDDAANSIPDGFNRAALIEWARSLGANIDQEVPPEPDTWAVRDREGHIWWRESLTDPIWQLRTTGIGGAFPWHHLPHPVTPLYPDDGTAPNVKTLREYRDADGECPDRRQP